MSYGLYKDMESFLLRHVKLEMNVSKTVGFIFYLTKTFRNQLSTESILMAMGIILRTFHKESKD